MVVGGVVVAPRASELIHAVSVAVGRPADGRRARPRLHGLPVDVRVDRRGGAASPHALNHRALNPAP
ncbi:MAG: hypothetical protein WKF76_06205 [Nocardioidaceae bacterium]